MRSSQLVAPIVVALALSGGAIVPAQVGKVEVKAEPGGQVPPVEVKKQQLPGGNADKALDRLLDGMKIEAKKVDAPAPVAAPVVRRLALTAVEPWVERYTVRLRPMVHAEVHLIATTCSPDAGQVEILGREKERVLKEVARKFAEAQVGPRKPGESGMPEPQGLIAEAMAGVVKDHFSADQAARYRAESETRAESLKRVAIANLVANLDEELTLSEPQRAALAEALGSQWQPAWAGSLQSLMYGTQYFPNIPNPLLLPVLTPKQREAWQKRTRNGTMFLGNFQVLGDAMIEDPAAPTARPGGR